MPQANQRVGEYVLDQPIGRGSFGEVWRAKHHVWTDQLVAIKIPTDPQYVRNLQREGVNVHGLQHTNIVRAIGFDPYAETPYLAMEYVPGTSLRPLISGKKLSANEAVAILKQVLAGLGYAHQQGVIHRDVKPENILLHGNHALVADFGIALAAEQAARDGRMTHTGLSLGTPQYMAPEQVSGERAIDARADVYALGAVLYEMLAGVPPFAGPSARSVVARALTEEPAPLPTLRPHVPPHVAAAVHTALAKLPADRFAGATAFALALSAPAVAHRPASRHAAATLAATALAAAALGSVLGWTRGRASAAAALAAGQPLLRFTIEPDSAAPRIGAATISPDGRTVVFVGYGIEGARLYARRLEDLSVRPLPGTEDGDLPFFSPDGAWVGFHSHGALRRTRLDGGVPVVVARLSPRTWFGGGSWGEDDTIVFAIMDRGLFRVPASGGEATPVARPDTTVSLLYPDLLPGGRTALVTATPDQNAAHIGVVDLATGRLRRFGPGAGARQVGGHVVFAGLGGVLYRQRFDLQRLEPTGSAEQIASGLDASAVALATGTTTFDVSPGGALVYRMGASASSEGTLRLAVVDRSGRELRTVPARIPWAPRLAPDGRRVAYGAFAPGRDSSDIWITDLESGATQRVSADGRDSNDPQWSPDGQALAFSANADDAKDLFVQALRGGPARRLVRRPRSAEWPSDWADDGHALLYTAYTGEWDVWVQPLNGAPARPYLATAARERGARLSPDGRWVAYQSDETGRDEVYVQAFPVPGHKTLISAGGGIHPAWRGDGRELYYWQADQLIAARLAGTGADGPPTVRDRTPLFRAPYFAADLAMYDASPDGARFVLVTGGARTGRLVVALDALGIGGTSTGDR